MNKDLFEINISKPKNEFTNHLELIGNQRILFSGAFGTGKTFFLNHFFKDSNYDVIHLFPVNYSVAPNKDIFELIKYDLLLELLKKGLDFEKVEFPKLLTLQFFIKNNRIDIIKVLLDNINDLGKSAVTIAEPLVKLYESYKQFHKNIQTDEREQIINYLKSFAEIKGGLYEEDVMTQLISNLLEQIKAERKETVLIIDDLDRIDPEHIFRLLNVFAAHFDIKSQENKFGFDKVIFVCDDENVRNIFHAKYGSNVDFTGYLDKFYSKEIFRFDNKKMIEENVGQLLESIKITDKATLDSFPIHQRSSLFHLHTKYILSVMVRAGVINLRALIKLYNSLYTYTSYEVNLETSTRKTLS